MHITIIIGPFLPLPPKGSGAVEKLWHTFAQEAVRNNHKVHFITKRLKGQKKVSQIKNIKANSLTNILDNSIYKNIKIDLLTIDVEGHELSVLNGLNFNIYSPRVIVVEFLDLNVKKLEIKNLNIDVVINSELYKFLLTKNYTLANCIYSDLVFVHNEFRD